MSDITPQPGLRNQAGVRTALRAGGALLLVAALGLVVTGGVEFFTLQDFEEPHRFWMIMVGVPTLGIGLMMLQAGFAGAGARYAAGEYAPVAKDTAAYLSDGKGILGVGATGGTVAGPYCRSCGTRNDAEARFCDACGASLG
jgi:hypothetical protein